MALLKVLVLSDEDHPGKIRYKNKVNAKNFKEVSLILTDLRNLGLPIEKAIKDFNLIKNDWDAALGL